MSNGCIASTKRILQEISGGARRLNNEPPVNVQKRSRALVELEQLQAQRDKQRRAGTTEPRASTTDPEARVMKMADGGYRPALNVQFVTDQQTGLIVGVAVNNQGRDAGLMAPQYAELGGKDPYAPKSGDSPELAQFRQRMQTPEAKAIDKHRCRVAEFPNATCRNRGGPVFRPWLCESDRSGSVARPGSQPATTAEAGFLAKVMAR